MNDLDSNEDDLKLSESTLKALEQFYKEQEQANNKVEENWQLSQFWYDKKTADALKYEVTELVSEFRSKNKNETYRIACLSCPTLFQSIYDEYFSSTPSTNEFNIKLFEFDKRFGNLYNEDFFEFYDYNQSTDLKDENKNKYHLIIADPPYLANECLVKLFETINYLSVDGQYRLILCTGEVMSDFINENFHLNLCDFEPKHERNLANSFRCFTNYPPISFK